MRASRLALFLLLPIALGLIAACDGRPRSAKDGGAAEHEPLTGPALAILDLAGGVPEQPQTSLFGVSSHKESFDELLREIARIAKDTRAPGVLVRFGGASLGLARALELGEALEALGKTKPVTCHAEGYTNATLYAAARGCSKIYVSPAGDVEAIGIAAQVVYMRKLLADNLGLTIDILQVGKFKGAEEPLTRDGPSDEARASLEGTLSSIRDVWIDGMHKGRPKADADAAEDGPYSPSAAKERGLIDEVAYLDEARDVAKRACGAAREEIRFGAGSGGGKSDDLGDLVRILAGEGASTAPIALVRATGSISMSGGGGVLGGSSGITERELVRTLVRLERDDDVKAVVLRIDSPGGSALASDLIWHHLMKLRAKKPLVVSVGEMAASGGYYLASAGHVIYADALSIVGSIGVVGGKVAIGGALEKIGVHAETFAAKKNDPKAASRAAYLSPLSSWDAATKVRVLETMTGIYRLFLDRIIEGRAGKITREKLEQSAEGRIFSGLEGKERGLVDELGGLAAAIERARELAHLGADARVVAVGRKPGLLEALGGGGDDGDEAHAASLTDGAARALARGLARGPGVIDLVTEAVPELAPFAEGLAVLARGEKTLAAMPYAILIR